MFNEEYFFSLRHSLLTCQEKHVGIYVKILMQLTMFFCFELNVLLKCLIILLVSSVYFVISFQMSGRGYLFQYLVFSPLALSGLCCIGFQYEGQILSLKTGFLTNSSSFNKTKKKQWGSFYFSSTAWTNVFREDADDRQFFFCGWEPWTQCIIYYKDPKY